MRKAVFLLLLLFLGMYCWGQGTFLYRFNSGKKSETISYTISKIDASFKISSAQGGESRQIITDFSMAAESFHYTNTDQGTDYTAIRVGNKIKLKGRLKNRNINKEFSINGNQWYQAIEQALEHFAGSSQTHVTFWFINAESSEIMEMEASKQKIETVRVNGAPQKALHVKVNLTGLAALFWGADYWFRPGDSRFLLYRTAEGPGGPEITMEYQGEADK